VSSFPRALPPALLPALPTVLLPALLQRAPPTPRRRPQLRPTPPLLRLLLLLRVGPTPPLLRLLLLLRVLLRLLLLPQPARNIRVARVVLLPRRAPRPRRLRRLRLRLPPLLPEVLPPLLPLLPEPLPPLLPPLPAPLRPLLLLSDPALPVPLAQVSTYEDEMVG